MDAFVIHGGPRLVGRLAVNGSKNAALPLMATALLTDQPIHIEGAPRLADIASMVRLLEDLGCETSEEVDAGASATAGREPERTLTFRSADWTASHARYEIVRTMRASICALGPMLARRGQARISMPGGCAIGDRPVDLHLRGLAALGADIALESGDIVATAPGHAPGRPGRLRGATIFLGGPFGSTVLGTANILCAATLARGQTIIESAACEPEIVDLARLLSAMGARIEGAGTPRIVIEGVEELDGGRHRVMPDRIEAGTFMMAAAMTRGRLTLENCPLDAMLAVSDRLQEIGVRIEADETAADPLRATCEVTMDGPPLPAQMTTQPYPGFPTDLQAQLLSLLTLADGNSVITEKIYPERYLHVAELSRMGARIFRQGPTVVVSGVRRLVGAPVMASDLRASASLVMAGLAAEGTTIIRRVYHLDRGYEAMEEVLSSIGARIERVDDKDLLLDGTPLGALESGAV